MVFKGGVVLKSTKRAKLEETGELEGLSPKVAIATRMRDGESGACPALRRILFPSLFHVCARLISGRHAEFSDTSGHICFENERSMDPLWPQVEHMSKGAKC